MARANAMTRRHRERAPRIQSETVFYAATFGTEEVYKLSSVNISYSGMLLASPTLLPYQIKTLVELSAEIPYQGDQVKIEFLGKIVRLAKGNSSGLQKYASMFDLSDDFVSIFGVNIIDISEEYLQIWKHYVDQSHQMPQKNP